MVMPKDIAIKRIIQDFEKVANQTLTQLDIMNNILKTYKGKIPENIIKKLNKNEKRIDQQEVRLEKNIIRTIVLYKPMASDIRLLFAIYRILISLERISDIIIKIMFLIRDIKNPEWIQKTLPMLNNMFEMVTGMVNKSLLSFNDKNIKHAVWTIKKDEEIDELNQKLVRKSIKKTDIPKDIHDIMRSLVDVRSIISSIERIGDHATNNAEASIYAIVGTTVRHRDIDKEKI